MRWLSHVVIGSVIAFAVYSVGHHLLYSAEHSNYSGPSLPIHAPNSVQPSDIVKAVQRFHSLLPGGAAPPPAAYQGGIWYSPSTNLEQIDINEINQIKTGHLDIAMYAFTDIYIARAVLAAADRGVTVRIYRDNEQWAQEQHRDRYVLSLLESNPNIHIRVKGSQTLMHLKAYCDGSILREGSANWSPSGEMQQDNTLTLTKDPQAVASFESDFNHIWNRPSNIVIQ